MAGEQNSSGDDQKKLDVLSNDIFINALIKRARGEPNIFSVSVYLSLSLSLSLSPRI